MEQPETTYQRPTIWFMVLTGFMVGTLDATVAIIDFVLAYHGNPLISFQYIAGGILGVQTFSGGLPTAFLGIFIHYVIAASWTAVFFLLYPRMKLLRSNWILIGILFALFIWVAMNLGVRPLSRVPPVSWTLFKVFKSAAILIVAVGLPISFIAKQYYGVQKDPEAHAPETSQEETKGPS